MSIMNIVPELPWEDDGVIRGVVCKGRKILQKQTT